MDHQTQPQRTSTKAITQYKATCAVASPSIDIGDTASPTWTRFEEDTKSQSISPGNHGEQHLKPPSSLVNQISAFLTLTHFYQSQLPRATRMTPRTNRAAAPPEQTWRNISSHPAPWPTRTCNQLPRATRMTTTSISPYRVRLIVDTRAAAPPEKPWSKPCLLKRTTQTQTTS